MSSNSIDSEIGRKDLNLNLNLANLMPNLGAFWTKPKFFMRI